MNTHQVDLDPSTQTEIIQKLSERLKATYVFPDIAERICSRLEKNLEAGEYTDIAEGRFFAFALTVHMQEECQDEHLWVRWHPEPLPDQEGALRENQDWLDEQQQAALEDSETI